MFNSSIVSDFSVMRQRLTLRLALGAMLALSACTNPVTPSGDHLEAIELTLQSAQDSVLASTRDNSRWIGGPLRVMASADMPLRAVFLDVYNEPFTLEGRRDHTLRVDIEAPSVARWETVGGHGHLRGLQSGITRIRFHIWHGTHADFTSPWLELRVQSTVTSE